MAKMGGEGDGVGVILKEDYIKRVIEVKKSDRGEESVGQNDVYEQWRINNGAIGARTPGPRAPGAPKFTTNNFIGHNHSN